MNTMFQQVTLATAMLLAAGAAQAGATVTYADPEKFSDVPYDARERDEVLAQLSKHFDKLAARLPSGQELQVEVLDIDLAGRTRPSFRGGRDLRILKGGADWPHMKLRYTLTQGGQVLKTGQEVINSMDYMHRVNRYFTGDTLRYEKAMLDDWFKTALAAR